MKNSVWILGGLAVAATAYAGEVWKDKQPAEWQEKELSKFLAKSPWAKTVAMQMDPRRASGGRNNRGMGGGSPGGMGGGRTGGMGGGGRNGRRHG
jgi:thiamine biosynthesis protein ThiC